MSLLMDALKKAELAKRNAQLDNASSSSLPSARHNADTQATSAELIQPGLSSALAHTDTASRIETRTEIQADISATQSERFEFIDQEFLSETNRSAKVTKAPSLSLQEIDSHPTAPLTLAIEEDNGQQQEAIQNLFEAKKNSQVSQTTSSGKIFGIAIGVATLLALVAMGLYFWMELQPKSGLQRGPVSATYPGQETAKSSALTMPLAPVEQPAPPAATAAVAPTYAEEGSNNEALRARTNTVNTPNTRIRQPPPEPAKKTFRIASANPPSNTTLDRAYDALTRGDDVTAKTAYVKALDADPKNIDALAGLAVISQRAGNTAQAADYYVQMLDADPRNALALSGLINLQSRMDPFEAETRVKQALSTQPDSPALNFTLGNVYARSKRWNDAQQAYFKAITGDPGNPDYLFNLAISLDQLRQPKLAANYYAQAITAIDNRPGSFDKTKASERLQQLQQ